MGASYSWKRLVMCPAREENPPVPAWLLVSGEGFWAVTAMEEKRVVGMMEPSDCELQCNPDVTMAQGRDAREAGIRDPRCV